MSARVAVVVLLAAVGCTGAPARETSARPAARPAKPAEAKPRGCVDPDHCGPHLGHCLDVCFKYNHPNGPANDACDARCRESHCARVPCAHP